MIKVRGQETTQTKTEPLTTISPSNNSKANKSTGRGRKHHGPIITHVRIPRSMHKKRASKKKEENKR